MRNLNTFVNTLCVIKSEYEFSMKSSATTPLDFSKLRVEVLLKALLVEHKCEHTNNTKHVYNMSNVVINARYNERELKIVDQTQTSRYVSRFEPLLYVPTFTHKDFHHVHTGPSTKEPLPRNYNSTLGVRNSSLSTIPLHKRKHKVKKK